MDLLLQCFNSSEQCAFCLFVRIVLFHRNDLKRVDFLVEVKHLLLQLTIFLLQHGGLPVGSIQSSLLSLLDCLCRTLEGIDVFLHAFSIICSPHLGLGFKLCCLFVGFSLCFDIAQRTL